jgi:hypothetical protein
VEVVHLGGPSIDGSVAHLAAQLEVDALQSGRESRDACERVIVELRAVVQGQTGDVRLEEELYGLWSEATILRDTLAQGINTLSADASQSLDVFDVVRDDLKVGFGGRDEASAPADSLSALGRARHSH